MLRRAWCAIACAIAAFALPSAAQEVRGRALSPGGASPVAGVIVMLADTGGFVVDRTLTSSAGTFRLRASRPDVYRIRAIRVGFRPSVSAPFTLATRQVVERSIELTERPVTLAAMLVSAERKCDVRPDSSSSAFEAWEEARKALDAARLTRDRRYTMEMVRFERRTKARTGALLAESEVDARGQMSRPFVSVPLAQLDATGYVHQDAMGVTFRAPDEDVLLSEQFAATHCLRLAKPSADDEVSLEFEPVGDRTVADIRGTLALDRATGALRRLDFSFVNIARDIQREGAGGRVNFRPLPSGGWIIDRWALRFPMLERVISRQPERGHDIRFGNRGRESKYELYAIQEAGGEVTEVSLGDTLVWQLERPELTGVVRDARGAPIAGATVSIPTLGRRAVTDGSGRFAMRAVRRGRRTITVTAPVLDSLGIAPISRDADTRAANDVALTIPVRDSLLGQACDMPAEETRTIGFVRGITRGPRGERVPGVRIVSSWFQGTGAVLDTRNPGVMITRETVSGAMGEYSLCDVRVDQLITMRMSLAGKPAGVATMRVPADARIVLLDLPVRPSGPSP